MKTYEHAMCLYVFLIGVYIGCVVKTESLCHWVFPLRFGQQPYGTRV